MILGVNSVLFQVDFATTIAIALAGYDGGKFGNKGMCEHLELERWQAGAD